uniref:50S ribosomal protein L2 n=1 Tax=Schistosoma curassoni TaxID=6186 RepID=A0A183KDC6_9TREM
MIQPRNYHGDIVNQRETKRASQSLRFKNRGTDG